MSKLADVAEKLLEPAEAGHSEFCLGPCECIENIELARTLIAEDRVTGESRMRIKKAIEVASSCGALDGAHHKMWVIDQMVRALLGDEYQSWEAMQEGWDVGIAP